MARGIILPGLKKLLLERAHWSPQRHRSLSLATLHVYLFCLLTYGLVRLSKESIVCDHRLALQEHINMIEFVCLFESPLRPVPMWTASRQHQQQQEAQETMSAGESDFTRTSVLQKWLRERQKSNCSDIGPATRMLYTDLDAASSSGHLYRVHLWIGLALILKIVLFQMPEMVYGWVFDRNRNLRQICSASWGRLRTADQEDVSSESSEQDSSDDDDDDDGERKLDQYSINPRVMALLRLCHNSTTFRYRCALPDIVQLLSIGAMVLVWDCILYRADMQHVFSGLGVRMVQYWLNNDSAQSMSPSEEIFPSLVRCIYRSFGATGSRQTSELMCAMDLNYMFDKLFIFTWFYYAAFSLSSIAALTAYVARTVSNVVRRRWLSQYLDSVTSICLFRKCLRVPLELVLALPYLRHKNAFHEIVILEFLLNYNQLLRPDAGECATPVGKRVNFDLMYDERTRYLEVINRYCGEKAIERALEEEAEEQEEEVSEHKRSSESVVTLRYISTIGLWRHLREYFQIRID